MPVHRRHNTIGGEANFLDQLSGDLDLSKPLKEEDLKKPVFDDVVTKAVKKSGFNIKKKGQ